MGIKNEKILIMDFGGQYTQLIARRVRECNVYCEIKPYKISAEEIKKEGNERINEAKKPKEKFNKNLLLKKPKLYDDLMYRGFDCVNNAHLRYVYRHYPRNREV